MRPHTANLFLDGSFHYPHQLCSLCFRCPLCNIHHVDHKGSIPCVLHNLPLSLQSMRRSYCPRSSTCISQEASSFLKEENSGHLSLVLKNKHKNKNTTFKRWHCGKIPHFWLSPPLSLSLDSSTDTVSSHVHFSSNLF